MPTSSQFHVHDDVRLLVRHGDVPPNALGRILGRFARELDPTFCVRFNAENVYADDIRSDEIVLAGAA